MNAEDAVFRLFGLDINGEKTMRQISIDTGIAYMTLNRAIKELKKKELFTTKKQGMATVCSLNKENPLTKQHLILADESFKNEFIQKKPLLKEITKTICENAAQNTSALLFGSYAKGTEQRHSDIDIAFISSSKTSIKKIQAELRTIEKIHDTEINTMAFTEKQFKEMLAAKEENVGKQIMKNHVILHNPELFWNIVYEAQK